MTWRAGRHRAGTRPETAAELRRLVELFGGEGQAVREDAFGFDKMIQSNAEWLFARYRYSAFGIEFALERYIPIGVSMRILEGGGGIVDLDTGQFTSEPSEREVRYLLLTPEYEKTTRVIRRYADSPLLPAEIRAALSEYLRIVEEDVILLGNVLEEASHELPIRYPTAETPTSYIWISNRFVQRIKPLSPIRQTIIQKIQQYVAK